MHINSVLVPLHALGQRRGLSLVLFHAPNTLRGSRKVAPNLQNIIHYKSNYCTTVVLTTIETILLLYLQ